MCRAAATSSEMRLQFTNQPGTNPGSQRHIASVAVTYLWNTCAIVDSTVIAEVWHSHRHHQGAQADRTRVTPAWRGHQHLGC